MKGRIAGTLFALPFSGFGLWMLFSIVGTLTDAHAMRQWLPTDATLSTGGYETRHGDDSETYEAYASYHYDYGGRTYSGTRVALAAGSDNIGDYQRRLGERLGDALRRGEKITVYVDPEDPRQAVVDRSIRWGLIGFKSIFVVVFGGFGLGALVFLWLYRPKEVPESPELERMPWLRNSAWQSATITSSSRLSMWVAWGFAGFWNAVSAPLPFVVHGEVTEKGNAAALLGLLFPVVGLGLIVWAIRRTLEWRRFGPLPLTLDPFPGSIGGHVGGFVDLARPHDPSARFTVTLTCIRSYMSGSGKNRSRSEKAEWQDSRLAAAEAGGPGTRLSFRFDVPEGLPEADAVREGDAHYLWRANLNAKLPGTDIDRDYDVPVYRTAQSSRRLSDRAVRSAAQEQERLHAADVRNIVRLSHGAGGSRLYYPAGRNAAAALIGAGIGSIFAGSGWFIISGAGKWFFGGVFLAVGLLVTLAALYTLLNSLEVLREGTTLVSKRRLLGVPVSTRRLTLGAIAKLEARAGFQTRSGGRHVMHYSIRAIGNDGEVITLGEGFRGAGLAEAGKRFIAEQLSLPIELGRAVAATPEAPDLLLSR